MSAACRPAEDQLSDKHPRGNREAARDAYLLSPPAGFSSPAVYRQAHTGFALGDMSV